MVEWMSILFGTAIILFLLAGIRIVRPSERAIIERLGKYRKYAKSGFNWVIPVIDRLMIVDITENIADALTQEVITKDNLNTKVSAQVYYKVKADEDNVKFSQYNVANYEEQIIALASTTLRNIMGTLTLVESNSQRGKINKMLMETLTKETKNWGIEVVRTELKEISPPGEVQDTMNRVVIAENEKIAAKDFANAAEIKADGIRRARIKEADGEKQFAILRAEGEARAIELVNKALRETFKGEAQIFKKLQVAENALMNNSKYVIDTKTGITNVISDISGVPFPIKERQQGGLK